MDDIPLSHVPLFFFNQLVARESLRPKQPDAGRDVPRLPDEIWVLAERCWSHVPSDRPLAKDIRDALKQITNSTSPVTRPPATLTDGSPSMVLPRSKRSKALFPDASEGAETLLIASEEIRKAEQAREQKDAAMRAAEHLAQEAERQDQEERAREKTAAKAVRKQKAEIRAAKAAEEKREREHAELTSQTAQQTVHANSVASLSSSFVYEAYHHYNRWSLKVVRSVSLRLIWDVVINDGTCSLREMVANSKDILFG